MEAVRIGGIWVVLLAVLLFARGAAFSSEVSPKSITALRVRDMLKQGGSAWLIDVRNASVYEESHIEGAVNIASKALQFKTMPAGKTIILVDDSLGQKDAKGAAAALQRNNVQHIYILEGGFPSWRLEGLPVTGKTPYRIKGVTAGALKAALSEGTPLRIFDMRDAHKAEKNKLPDSERVEGQTVLQRVASLAERLKAEQMYDLQSRLGKGRTVVLVFSASENVEMLTAGTFDAYKGDVRYLVGGSEGLTADRAKKMAGGCRTCPSK